MTRIAFALPIICLLSVLTQARAYDTQVICYHIAGRALADPTVHVEAQVETVLNDMQKKTGLTQSQIQDLRPKFITLLSKARDGWAFAETMAVSNEVDGIYYNVNADSQVSRELTSIPNRLFYTAGFALQGTNGNGGGTVLGSDQGSPFDGPADTLALVGSLAPCLKLTKQGATGAQYRFNLHQSSSGTLQTVERNGHINSITSAESLDGSDAIAYTHYSVITGTLGKVGCQLQRDQYCTVKGRKLCKSASIRIMTCTAIKGGQPHNLASFFSKGALITDYRLGQDKPTTYHWNGHVPDAAMLSKQTDPLAAQAREPIAMVPWLPVVLGTGVVLVAFELVSRLRRHTSQ